MSVDEHKMIMQTYSGHYIDLMDMDLSLIDIVDVARSLSNQGRFGGHTCLFMSVAEHSVLASQIAETLCDKFELEMQEVLEIQKDSQYRKIAKDFSLACLMHDAPEAYLSDVITPVKNYLSEYKVIEYNIQRQLEDAFSIGNSRPESSYAIKMIDELLLCIESTALLPNSEDIIRNTLPRLPKFVQNWFTEEFNAYGRCRSFTLEETMLPDEAMRAFLDRFNECKLDQYYTGMASI